MTCHQAEESTNLLTLAASPSTPVTLLHAIRNTVADDAVEGKEGRRFVWHENRLFWQVSSCE